MAKREIRFVVYGGPHKGLTENPTCYARTTQSQRFYRWTRPRVSKATGKLLPTHLRPWARYQDYVEHVRASLPEEAAATLHDVIWKDLCGRKVSYRVDIVAQFVGKRHSDPDHVASTIADALFPGPIRSKPARPGRTGSSTHHVWSRAVRDMAPDDSNVLARVLDYRDMADAAFVAVRVHGPYDRALFHDLGALCDVLGGSTPDPPALVSWNYLLTALGNEYDREWVRGAFLIEGPDQQKLGEDLP